MKGLTDVYQIYSGFTCFFLKAVLQVCSCSRRKIISVINAVYITTQQTSSFLCAMEPEMLQGNKKVRWEPRRPQPLRAAAGGIQAWPHVTALWIYVKLTQLLPTLPVNTDPAICVSPHLFFPS